MKTNLKVSVACGLAALLMSVGAQAEVSFGADAEFDITSSTNDKLEHGGRIKLSASAEQKGDNYFVKGVAQPLYSFVNNDVAYDDVFLQFGQSAWDVQMGRFEGIDLMPAGKDTYIANAGAVSAYSANMARGRKADVLHTAFHAKPSDAVTLELGVMLDNENDGDDKVTAFRPAVVYNAGMATISAGYESYKTTTGGSSTTDKGFGVNAGVNVGGGTLNAGIAAKTPDTGDKTTTIKLNYTQGPWGVGLVNSKEGDAKQNDLFAAYTMPLLGSDKATVTFAASTSRASGSSNADDDNGVRARFNYTF